MEEELWKFPSQPLYPINIETPPLVLRAPPSSISLLLLFLRPFLFIFLFFSRKLDQVPLFLLCVLCSVFLMFLTLFGVFLLSMLCAYSYLTCPIDLMAQLNLNSNFVECHLNNLPNMKTSAFVFFLITVLTETCGGV